MVTMESFKKKDKANDRFNILGCKTHDSHIVTDEQKIPSTKLCAGGKSFQQTAASVVA